MTIVLVQRLFATYLVCVTESLDNTPEGKLMQSVRGYVAEVERQKIRERCIRGKRQRVLSGLIHRAGTELYGYRRDKERGVREIYEPEASVVRQMYRWVLEGVSTRQIIFRLNAQGTPAPSVGKRAFKDGRTPYWGKGAVGRILSDPTYKGEAWSWRFKSGKRWREIISRPKEEWIRLPDETTPAIVTRDMWQAVQERLKTNCGDEARNRHRPDLLRGRVFCAVCGRKMRGDSERWGRHNRVQHRVYRCSSRNTPFGACGAKRIPAVDCEQWAWAKVENVLLNPEIIEIEIERRRSEGQDSSAQLRADLEAARREFKRLEEGQQRLIRRLRDDLSDDLVALFEKEIAQAEQEKARFQSTIREIEARLASDQEVQKSLAALSEYCARVSDRLASFTFEEKRLALEAMGARLIGTGREWRIDVSIPCDIETGALPISNFLSARPAQARR